MYPTLRSVKQKNMVFRKPGNSRDDKSNKTSGSSSRTNSDRKTTSSSRGRSAGSGFGKTESGAPKKRYGSDAPGDRKSFSPRPKSSFGANDSEDRPKKFNRMAGAGKKPVSPSRSKPTSDRFSKPGSDDRRPKSFGGGNKFGAGSRPASSDRGGKSFDGGRPGSSDRASKSFDDRPKRNFGGDATGDKKFAPRTRSTNTEGTGDKKFSRSSDKPAFRKPTGDFKDKPFRKNEEGKPFRKSEEDKPFRKSDEERPAREGNFEARQPSPARTMRGRKKGPVEENDGLIRLNRYISNAGICSRRKADELIVAGVISVNGEVVSELGFKVDPMKDQIRYNGETLKREKMVYVLLNKPKDYITTTDDPQERRTVMHLVEKASRERIYPVGRLDRNTTGLLLMTNDGDLADKLSHPRNSVVKLYQVELNKPLTQGDLNKISFGLELEDGVIKPDTISYVTGGTKKEIGIQIHSGKNRIVRRIFEHLGYDVVKLDRAVYANLNKKDLPRGRWRYLDEQEVIQLKHLIK